MKSDALALPGAREVVAFRPALARALECPLAALYLSQAMYWQKIAGVGNWWFKLRDADRGPGGNMLAPASRARQSWEWELCMSRTEQENARKLLRRLGLIEEDRRGVPARLFYKVDIERIEKFVAKIVDCSQPDGEFQPASRQGRAKLKGSSCQQDGAIQPPNAESSQRLKKSSSRRREAAPLPSPSSEAACAATLCAKNEKKHFRYSSTGVECWTDADRQHTAGLQEKYGSEKVIQAVQDLLAGKTNPLPFRVEKQILRTIVEIEKREKFEAEAKSAANAKAALATKDELVDHGKKAIKALTIEQRRSYALNYIVAAEGKEHSSSYQPATAEFKDPKERMMFTGWLHKQMRMERCNWVFRSIVTADSGLS